jgi:hypothetical protein
MKHRSQDEPNANGLMALAGCSIGLTKTWRNHLGGRQGRGLGRWFSDPGLIPAGQLVEIDYRKTACSVFDSSQRVAGEEDVPTASGGQIRVP